MLSMFSCLDRLTKLKYRSKANLFQVRIDIFLPYPIKQRLILLQEKIMSDFKAVAADVEPGSVLDTKGLSCPMPLLRTKKEMGKLASGDILQVDGTDPGSRNDLPGWCERAGHEYLGEKE